MTEKTYKAKDYNLSGLAGISDKTLEMHFKLYQGYVKGTNSLNEEIIELIEKGEIESPSYAELTRRLGFEYNGMVLHEYYFGNMKKDGSGDPGAKSAFYNAAKTRFGSYETWKADFVGVGKMRGVGWAICFEDPSSGLISNHWVTLHEVGLVAGFKPILVMDVWEHAFILDYAPADRPKYIEAFFQNIDWDTVNARLQPASAARG